jgi:hypothetical protein
MFINGKLLQFAFSVHSLENRKNIDTLLLGLPIMRETTCLHRLKYTPVDNNFAGIVPIPNNPE